MNDKVAQKDEILLIQTGGTIDSEAYADPRNPPKNVSTLKGEESILPSVVNTLKRERKVRIFKWDSKDQPHFIQDSKAFSYAHLEALAKMIRAQPEQKIIVTHGTDAMADNACMLKGMLESSGKTVVFVGAMVPLIMKYQHRSDGVEYLDNTLHKIDSLEAGVYIMGRHTQKLLPAFHDPDGVTKDRPASTKTMQFTLR